MLLNVNVVCAVLASCLSDGFPSVTFGCLLACFWGWGCVDFYLSPGVYVHDVAPSERGVRFAWKEMPQNATEPTFLLHDFVPGGGVTSLQALANTDYDTVSLAREAISWLKLLFSCG